MDPRLGIIDERLEGIRQFVAIASGKGGVGKSLISTVLALQLSRKGYEVGLLDLDLHGPSTHTIMGSGIQRPKEEKGIIPPETQGVKSMSIVSFTGEDPSLLRGNDVSNAIVELLTITRWGSLDFLIIDMPPGIGDETLDIIRLVKEAKFLVVTTPSRVALTVVKKLIRTLKELKVPILGVVENMKMDEFSLVEEEVSKLHVSFLGEIKFDEQLEKSIGNVKGLLDTEFAKDLEKILEEVNLDVE